MVSFSSITVVLGLLCIASSPLHHALKQDESFLVKKEARIPVIETENGHVTKVSIFAGTRDPAHLQFFSLDPNSLFLPVVLHEDMVFYVQTGMGSCSWTIHGNELQSISIRKGDVLRLQTGSVFYFQSSFDAEKLRISAIFSNTGKDIFQEAPGEAYTSVSDFVLRFDQRILHSAFKISEDEVAEIISQGKPPGIVPSPSSHERSFISLFTRGDFLNKKEKEKEKQRKKKTLAPYNILGTRPYFRSCNGWLAAADEEDTEFLRGSNIGVLAANLERGSMMGPRWNAMVAEIGVVVHGGGVIQVVCPGKSSASGCKEVRLRVDEGDVFAVPRLHPAAHVSFNNGSLMFVGFSITSQKNSAQYLVGKRTMLKALETEVVAASFNVHNSTLIEKLLMEETQGIIVDCVSCAEDLLLEDGQEMPRQKEEEILSRWKEI